MDEIRQKLFLLAVLALNCVITVTARNVKTKALIITIDHDDIKKSDAVVADAGELHEFRFLSSPPESEKYATFHGGISPEGKQKRLTENVPAIMVEDSNSPFTGNVVQENATQDVIRYDAHYLNRHKVASVSFPNPTEISGSHLGPPNGAYMLYSGNYGTRAKFINSGESTEDTFLDHSKPYSSPDLDRNPAYLSDYESVSPDPINLIYGWKKEKHPNSHDIYDTDYAKDISTSFSPENRAKINYEPVRPPPKSSLRLVELYPPLPPPPISHSNEAEEDEPVSKDPLFDQPNHGEYHHHSLQNNFHQSRLLFHSRGKIHSNDMSDPKINYGYYDSDHAHYPPSDEVDYD